MIPRDFIAEWKKAVPWPQNNQVEQDLIICRALVEIFNHPDLQDQLAFRGGTALFKLHLPPLRYSEDIDLVQVCAGRPHRPGDERPSGKAESLAGDSET